MSPYEVQNWKEKIVRMTIEELDSFMLNLSFSYLDVATQKELHSAATNQMKHKKEALKDALVFSPEFLVGDLDTN